MLFRQLFDPESSICTYLLADEQTREAARLERAAAAGRARWQRARRRGAAQVLVMTS